MSYLLAERLITQHGLDHMLGYFRSFSRRVDRRANFAAAFGQSLDEFEREALVHLATVAQ